jgi:hypothetical protein
MSTSDTGVGDAAHSSKVGGVSESLSSDVTSSNSRGYVQRIYSDDKLSPDTLSGLRAQKMHAEDKLKQLMNGVKRSQVEDPEAGRSKQDDYMTVIRPVSTCSTDRASDPESQGAGEETRKGKIKPAHAQSSTREYKLLPEIHQNQPQHSSFKPFRIISPSKFDCDACSVSTITGGDRSVNSEDHEYNVISQQYRAGVMLSTPGRNRKHFISTAADDFGSMAGSVPSNCSDG